MVTKIANESTRSSDGSERLQYGGSYLDEVTSLEPPGLFGMSRPPKIGDYSDIRINRDHPKAS